MEPILLLAYWPDRVETCGGRRRDLPRLLRHYCQGATHVGPNLAKGDFLAKSGRSRATIGRASA
jgi:hypothetical protein